VRVQVQEVALEIGQNYKVISIIIETVMNNKQLMGMLTRSREKMGPSGRRLTMKEFPFCMPCQSKRPWSSGHEEIVHGEEATEGRATS